MNIYIPIKLEKDIKTLSELNNNDNIKKMVVEYLTQIVEDKLDAKLIQDAKKESNGKHYSVDEAMDIVLNNKKHA